MIRGGKVAKRKSTTVLQEGTKKKCVAGAASSRQTSLQSHFKPLQPKQAPTTSASSKRRYVDNNTTTPWEETNKIRPELPTPPFGEDSPAYNSSQIPSTVVIPLPPLNFAANDKIWAGLKHQEEKRQASKLGILQHPHIKQGARAILLDWLIEVSQLYCLKRETFYLSMDYIDRFISKRPDIKKDQLQLVGITALHMAGKLEEIYPPGLEKLSYITDNSCSKDAMWKMELEMMKALDWKLAALTVNTWLNLYLQIEYYRGISCTTFQFLRAEYSQSDFVKIIQLIDLCSLDVKSVEYRPSMIAASALWLVVPSKLKEVTGYSWDDLISCRHWMQPYAQVLKDQPAQQLKDFEDVDKKDRHHIQTHFNAIPLLHDVYELQESQPLTPESDSDNENAEVAHYLTPNSSVHNSPSSSKHR